jgi:hypothetical protein
MQLRWSPKEFNSNYACQSHSLFQRFNQCNSDTIQNNSFLLLSLPHPSGVLTLLTPQRRQRWQRYHLQCLQSCADSDSAHDPWLHHIFFPISSSTPTFQPHHHSSSCWLPKSLVKKEPFFWIKELHRNFIF